MSDRLPDDIQRLILDKVLSPRDHARFSCACRLWYSIYKERTFPWFVLADHDHDNENHTRGFFSVYDQKIYRINAPELEEPYTRISHGLKQICGSSHDWLVTIDNECDFGLYNPFSKSFIQLPPSPFEKLEWKGSRTRRVILSCNPCTNPNECTIMLLDYHGNLVYCKLGDKSWAPISSEIDGIFDYFQDVIFYKGDFVVVCRSQMFICHIFPEPHFTPFGPKMSARTRYIYLVNLEGDVVIVDRYDPSFVTDSEDEEDDNGVDLNEDEEDDNDGQNDNGSDLNEDEEDGYLIQDEQNSTNEDSDEDEDFVTLHFDVYKLDKDMTSWRKENDIGDRILFLGSHESVLLPTSSVPNSIANTAYYGAGLLNARIFLLKTGKSTVPYPRDGLLYYLESSPPICLIQN